MTIRKIFASFFIFLFIVAAVPNFYLYALNKTFFSGEFYANTVVEQSYEYLLTEVSTNIHGESEMISTYYSVEELDAEIREAYTVAMFKGLMTELGANIEKLKQNPEQPVNLNLTDLRDSMLTVANSLTYDIFKKLPTCASEADFKNIENAFPRCVPAGVDYELIVAPIISEFEVAIYNEVPDEVDNLNSFIPGTLIANVQFYSNILFIVLISILVVIAFLVYKPFSTVIKYHSIAIVLAGMIGLGMSFLTDRLLITIFNSSSLSEHSVATIEYASLILGFISDEVLRLSLLFLIAGFGFMVIHLFLKKTID